MKPVDPEREFTAETLGLTGRIWLPKEVLEITRNIFKRP